MMHLLPFRYAVQSIVLLVGIILLLALYGGWFGGTDFLAAAAQWTKVSSVLTCVIIALSYAAWRWTPMGQRFLFPYLGGCWKGEVEFEGKDGKERRAVTLEVKHTIVALQFMLESAESVSWTMVVYPERHRHFRRFWLYYLYRNRRKEGVPGANQEYQGLAVIRVEEGSPLKLVGDYFTDTHRSGILRVALDSPNPWWKLWG